jgi:hypothetical protein
LRVTRGRRRFEPTRSRGRIFEMTEPIPWLPLLQRLTEAAPSWGVWKHAESALDGEGDIDSTAARAEWGTIAREFCGWASSNGFAPVVVCTHVPGLLVLTACAGDSPTRLLQVDVYSQHLFRGATVARAEQLRRVMELDPRGFRRLRPGAEGILSLLHAGLGYGGRPPRGSTAAMVDLARRDPDGACRLASVVGLPPSAVQAFERGNWDRPTVLAFELRALLRLFTDPKAIARCVVLDYRRVRPCSLLRALAQDRRVADGRVQWLREVGRSHALLEA